MNDDKNVKPLKKGLSPKRWVRVLERILITLCIVTGVACLAFTGLLIFLYNSAPTFDVPAPSNSSTVLPESSITGPTSAPNDGSIGGPILVTPVPSIIPAPNVSVTPAL